MTNAKALSTDRASPAGAGLKKTSRTGNEMSALLGKFDEQIGSPDKWTDDALERLNNWLVDTSIEINIECLQRDGGSTAEMSEQHATVDRQKILELLEKILASAIFSDALNQQKLLRYLVENTLDGNHDRLKGYCIGVEVFGRTPRLDPNSDSGVRAEAMRLRAKLCEYYKQDGKADPLRFHINKGSYGIIFHNTKIIPTHQTSGRT